MSTVAASPASSVRVVNWCMQIVQSGASKHSPEASPLPAFRQGLSSACRSGMYYVRLRAGEHEASRAVVLTR
jgi:hypothetical protein